MLGNYTFDTIIGPNNSFENSGELIKNQGV